MGIAPNSPSAVHPAPNSPSAVHPALPSPSAVHPALPSPSAVHPALCLAPDPADSVGGRNSEGEYL